VSEQQLLNNLLALAVVQNLQQVPAIVKLAAAGMGYHRIAALLGTTYDTVRVTASKQRVQRKKRTKTERKR
jgi:hypothetical protein